MIRLRHLMKKYCIGSQELTVLHDISLLIEQGEFVSVVGPSGSGKSTLMHILGCLDSPSAGEYIFLNCPIHEYSGQELARLRNQEIGFVFQNFQLLPRLTARQNVELPMIYAGLSRAVRQERVRELLNDLGLHHRMDHLPSELSGGQKQRVAIARALANRPAILLADEPTGALDSTTGKDIIGLFRELNQDGRGTTVILITHDAEVAASARRTIRIHDGSIVADERGTRS